MWKNTVLKIGSFLTWPYPEWHIILRGVISVLPLLSIFPFYEEISYCLFLYSLRSLTLHIQRQSKLLFSICFKLNTIWWKSREVNWLFIEAPDGRCRRVCSLRAVYLHGQKGARFDHWHHTNSKGKKMNKEKCRVTNWRVEKNKVKIIQSGSLFLLSEGWIWTLLEGQWGQMFKSWNGTMWLWLLSRERAFSVLGVGGKKACRVYTCKRIDKIISFL